MSYSPDDFEQAFFAHWRIEKTRAYLARGRRFAGLTSADLCDAWVDTYRAAMVLDDRRRDDELDDLASEFGLRGSEPPMHLVAREAKLVEQRLRNGQHKLDDARVEKLDELREAFQWQLDTPKN